MKFKIDTSKETWIYDNIESTLTDLNGVPFDFENFEGIERNPVFKKRPVQLSMPFGKKKDGIKHLRIQLGYKCNLNCAYCNQGESRDSTKFIKIVRDINDSQLIRSLESKELTLAEDARIEFWGGEPLVYKSLLTNLVPRLRAMFPTQRMGMVSNGTLLTKELVDWFVEHRVNLTISHDAQGYSLRGDKDPLDDQKLKEVWLYAKEEFKKNGLNFGFNVVITKENADVVKIADYFRTKFAPDAQWHYEGIVIPSDSSFFLKDKIWYRFRESLLEAISCDKPQEQIIRKLAEFYRSLYYKTNANTFRCRCRVLDENVLDVDLNGNLLLCHGSDKIIAKIDDLIFPTDVYQSWQQRSRSECDNCIALQLCKGGCPASSEEDHRMACVNLGRYYDSFICLAFFVLFGEAVTIRPY